MLFDSDLVVAVADPSPLSFFLYHSALRSLAVLTAVKLTGLGAGVVLIGRLSLEDVYSGRGLASFEGLCSLSGRGVS